MASKRKTSKRETSSGRARQGKETELEVLGKLAVGFRELHADRLGYLPPGDLRQALDQAMELGQIRTWELDPGGPAPKRGFELVGDEKIKARLRKVKNPRPKSSFGFASQPVEVDATGDLYGTTLKITLDKDMASGLDPATVRVFRFDESLRGWHMVARSGASLKGDYAWARIHRPGLYIPIGLPHDPWLLRTIMVIGAIHPWLRAARKMNALEHFLPKICTLILCGNMFKELRTNPTQADKFGVPTFLGGTGSGDPCELCLGLDISDLGLPEVAILREPPPLITGQKVPVLSPKKSPSTWESIGPNNFSSVIKSLAIHPTNGDIVYAGGAGGVWKTTDGGDTWHATMDQEWPLSISALGIGGPNSSDVLYAAFKEAYKTTNGGGNWNLPNPTFNDYFFRVRVHPTDPNTVYGASYGGIYKSTDGGKNWARLNLPPGSNSIVTDALIDPLSPNVVYAGILSSGVYKSADGGITWTLLTNGLPPRYAGWVVKLAMGLKGTHGTAFLLAKMGTQGELLYKSIDAGASWTQLPGTYPPATAAFNIMFPRMVAVDPNDEDVIFVGGEGLAHSSDGGRTFSVIGGVPERPHALVFSPTNSNICYLATEKGVYKSIDNGVNWQPKSYGMINEELCSIGVSQTSPFVLGSGIYKGSPFIIYSGAHHSSYYKGGAIKSSGSANWVDTGVVVTKQFTSNFSKFIVDPNNSNNIYLTPGDALLRSTSGGAPGSWTTILNVGLGIVLGNSHLAVKPGDSNLLLFIDGDRVYRSTDQGTNWNTVMNMTTPGTTTVRVAFSPSSPEICYATDWDGPVYRSSDSGATWSQPYAMADRPPRDIIGAIAVGWNDPDLVYIGYGGHVYSGPRVYRSTDGGKHWAAASGKSPSDALPDVAVHALVIDQHNPDVVYAATHIGVFRTRDGGNSWERFDQGMPRIWTSGLALHKSTNTLYASTMGRGAYKLEL